MPRRRRSWGRIGGQQCGAETEEQPASDNYFKDVLLANLAALHKRYIADLFTGSAEHVHERIILLDRKLGNKAAGRRDLSPTAAVSPTGSAPSSMTTESLASSTSRKRKSLLKRLRRKLQVGRRGERKQEEQGGLQPLQ
jgi:hypothetical protein